MNLYDNYLFKPLSLITYDCTSLSFPKITKSNISKRTMLLYHNIYRARQPYSFLESIPIYLTNQPPTISVVMYINN